MIPSHLLRASHTAPWQQTTSAYSQVRKHSSVSLRNKLEQYEAEPNKSVKHQHTVHTEMQ